MLETALLLRTANKEDLITNYVKVLSVVWNVLTSTEKIHHLISNKNVTK